MKLYRVDLGTIQPVYTVGFRLDLGIKTIIFATGTILVLAIVEIYAAAIP